MKAVWIGAWTAALAAGTAAGQDAEHAKLPFTFGKDTTVITQPRLPDGRPDYLGWLNARYGKGVTKDNNAAVLLVEVFGADLLPEKGRAEVCRLLGIDPPPAEGQWKPLPFSAEADRQWVRSWQGGPWKPAELPIADAWLDTNLPALAKIIEASGRPRHFVPLMAEAPALPMLTLQITSIAKHQQACKALCARANRSAGQGRPAAAWRDLLAAHRLGVLLEQQPSLLGQLVGIAVRDQATAASTRLMTAGTFRPPLLHRVQRELPSQSFCRTVPRALDELERCYFLDNATLMARDAEGTRRVLSKLWEMAEALRPLEEKGIPDHWANIKPGGPVARALLRACKSADWDAVLRRGNAFYDYQVRIMRETDLDRREKMAEALANSVARLKAEIKLSPWGEGAQTLEKRAKGGSAQTRWVGSMLLGTLLPDVGLRMAQMLAERTEMQHHLLRLAIALELYRSDHNVYPKALAALAPTYLKAVPRDFFSKKPLHYTKADGGYLLYSVGPNREDDGGEGKDDPRKGDLVVRKEAG